MNGGNGFGTGSLQADAQRTPATVGRFSLSTAQEQVLKGLLFGENTDCVDQHAHNNTTQRSCSDVCSCQKPRPGYEQPTCRVESGWREPAVRVTLHENQIWQERALLLLLCCVLKEPLLYFRVSSLTQLQRVDLRCCLPPDTLVWAADTGAAHWASPDVALPDTGLQWKPPPRPQQSMAQGSAEGRGRQRVI